MSIEGVTAWVQFAAELMILAGVVYNSVQSCLTNRKLRKVHTKVKSVEATAVDTASKIEEVKVTTADTNDRVTAVEISTNGMREALVLATKEEAFIRGQVAGVSSERERQQQDKNT